MAPRLQFPRRAPATGAPFPPPEASPPRTPLACGALGRYDRALLEEIGRRLGAGVGIVHSDRRSILALDRPPIRWRAPGTRGLAWSEGLATDLPSGTSSWRDAATAGACGLVMERGRRLLHTSISGIAPVYRIDCGDATYFASRIDPLVSALPGALSVDWEAWAAILSMRFAMEDRTPFREVRKLGPFSTLVRRRAGGVVEEPAWPWAQIEPAVDAREGAPAVADAIRDALASLPRRVNLTLSGGDDSRLLACFAAERPGAEVHSFTVGMDVGSTHEEELAARVARELGLAHTNVETPAGGHWEDMVERLVRCDFQYVGFPWPLPLARRLRSEPAPTLDGFGIDTLSARRNITERMLRADGGPRTARALWRRFNRRYGARIETMMSEPLAAAATSLSRRAMVRSSRPIRGTAAEALLTYYRTRNLRAIALLPNAVMGAQAPVLTPFADDRVARAILAIAPLSKRNGAMHREIFGLVNPRVGALPSTNDPRGSLERPQARRRDAPEVVAALDRALRDGPLTPHLAGELAAHLEAGTLDQGLHRRAVHRTANTIAAFHLWVERYGSRLGEVEPTEMVALADERARA